jgi:RNA 2',3'-cyclic 3'-phosphodiesterase
MKVRRIFAAIDIGDEAKAAIAAYIAGLRREFDHLRVGWERAEKLHITIKFAGALDEADLGKFIQTADRAAGSVSPFNVRVAGTGAFIKPRGSNVLWLGTEAEQIAGLAEYFYTPKNATGLPRRSFNPHLTIARLREPEKSRALIDRHLGLKFEPVEFEAAGIVIYESELLPAGSVYKVVSRHPFASRGS